MTRQGLIIHLYSIHGLIRGENLELGRDADTGGQTKYVLELAKALSKHEQVEEVSLFTRLIQDKTVSPVYANPIEELSDKVRIVRIQCGGTKYIRKELLWQHLDEFVDKTLKFVKDQDDIPDVVHGHYADAGYVAIELSTFWGVPCIFTGHSLGRVKRLDLQENGFTDEEMNKRFRIDHRIAVEEKVMSHADLIVASTAQETRVQYGHYDAQPSDRFCVIPPGIDPDRFYPFYSEQAEDIEEREALQQAQYYVQLELERFFTQPEKPLILALSRPDRRKNISGLISAYGMDKELQAIANLAVFAGIRKDISAMNDNEQEILTELLLLMDKFDLYGKLAIPKRHDVDYEVPELYRLASRKQGVFVNPAFKENFGLTLIEAASCGLPIIATDDGGPRDIIKNCQNGILIDVNVPEQICEAIKQILVDPFAWKEFSQNGIKGVRDSYTWEAHTRKYVAQLQETLRQFGPKQRIVPGANPVGRRFTHIKRFFLTDIDDTLVGDDEALEQLVGIVNEHQHIMSFGVVTGRPLDSVLDILDEQQIPQPDILISSVGTEIYYGKDLLPDKGWEAHISRHWNREKLQAALDRFPFLQRQEEAAQRRFKLSYYMEPSQENLAQVHHKLTQQRLRYTLIYSRDMYLDILPIPFIKRKSGAIFKL